MKKMICAMALFCFVGCEKKAEEATAEPANPTISADKSAKDPAAAKTPEKTTEDTKSAPTEETVAAATVGKPAPEFSLKDQDGKEHKLSDLKGSIVVLEWTCPTCPYVKRHYEKDTMQTTLKKFPEGKVKWLAIDSSNFVEAGKTAEWKKSEGFDYPVLLDADGKVGKMYNAKTTPHMFIIDAAGTLQYDGAIDNNPHGDAETVDNYVESVVGALLEGKPVPKSNTKPYGCSVKYKS